MTRILNRSRYCDSSFISPADCVIPLGMADGRIPDDQITASSHRESDFAYNARLNGPKSWCSKNKKSGKDEYIQVDLGEVRGRGKVGRMYFLNFGVKLKTRSHDYLTFRASKVFARCLFTLYPANMLCFFVSLQMKTIGTVGMQGRGSWYYWITAYHLYYSEDGEIWTPYTESGDQEHSNVST